MANTSLPVSIDRVTKAYGRVQALDEVSLEVGEGEFVSLLGPSGSGKTTLLMVLAGFVRPDSGSIRFGDTEVVRLPPWKRNVGVVFQNYALFPHMDVFNNVAYPLRQRRTTQSEIADRVSAVLRLVQLDGYEQRRIAELSGGQKQRVALARAIVFEPRVLLMDEPLSALDKKLRERMQIEIRSLHERLGVTTIYVTHDQREAITLSDRIAVINDGNIVEIATPQLLYEKPKTKFVADFIGESAFLPVIVDGGQAMLNGSTLRLTEPPQAITGQQYLLIRPEKLFVISGEEQAQEFNCIEGTVSGTVYQGETFLLTVTLGSGAEITVRHSTRRDMMALVRRPGEAITLGLHPEDTRLVTESA